MISLKVGDIDSARMLIRVDQGKGHKDRYVMLSQQLLDLLRRWWLVKRPRAWLFPGRVRGAPLTVRRLNDAVHVAARGAGIDKRVSMHTLRHSFVEAYRFIPGRPKVVGENAQEQGIVVHQRNARGWAPEGLRISRFGHRSRA